MKDASAETVRELAFVLATAPVVRPARTELELIAIPDDLLVEVSPWRKADMPFAVPPAIEWGDSTQTELEWKLVDDSRVIAKGTLGWPTAWRPIEAYAAELLRVLEAGLEPGCAPARPPASVPLGESFVLCK